MAAPAYSIGSLILLGTLVLTQTAEAEDGASAEAVFSDARSAMKEGRHEEACTKFGISYALQPAVGTLLNLALCDEEAGRIASAHNKYLRVLATLKDGDPRIPFASPRERALRARVPHLTLLKPRAAPATTIVLEAQDLNPFAWNQRRALDPGKHLFLVRSPNGRDQTLEVELVPGDDVVLEPKLLAPSVERVKVPVARAVPRAEATAVTKPAPPSSPSSSARSIAAWGTLGVAAGALAISGISTAMVLKFGRVVRRECTDDGRCTSLGINANSDGKSWARIGTASFAASLIGTGLGVWLMSTGSPQPDQAGTRTRPLHALGAHHPSLEVRVQGQQRGFDASLMWVF